MTAPSTKRIAAALAYAGLGAATGYGTVSMLKHASGGTPEWADVGAAVLAAAFAGIGLIILVLSLRRRPETGPSAPRQSQLVFERLQAGVLVVAGAMLALPILPGPGAGSPAASVTMLAVVACFLVQTALNWTLWRRSDEFLRRLISETASLCFWVLQAALFLWAAGERLGILPAIDAWGGVVVMMTVYLAASCFVSLRKGAA